MEQCFRTYRTDGTTTMGGEYIDEQTQQGRLREINR